LDHESSVLHYSPAHRYRIPIDAPAVIAEYTANMGGVDWKDRDSSDNSTSIRTTRYYLRIFFWILDSIIHAIYIIVCNYLESARKNFGWDQYNSTNSGRKHFQIDLAIQLIDFGIRLDWPEPFENKNKPPWIRQENFLHCDCKVCFFCQTGQSHQDLPFHQKQKWQLQIACQGDCAKIREQPQECFVCVFHVCSEATGEAWSIARKKCKRTRLGCKACQVVVCKDHCSCFTHDKGEYKK